MFFRESCFRQSGDKARKSNPTHYRSADRRGWVLIAPSVWNSLWTAPCRPSVGLPGRIYPYKFWAVRCCASALRQLIGSAVATTCP